MRDINRVPGLALGSTLGPRPGRQFQYHASNLFAPRVGNIKNKLIIGVLFTEVSTQKSDNLTYQLTLLP